MSYGIGRCLSRCARGCGNERMAEQTSCSLVGGTRWCPKAGVRTNCCRSKSLAVEVAELRGIVAGVLAAAALEPLACAAPAVEDPSIMEGRRVQRRSISTVRIAAVSVPKSVSCTFALCLERRLFVLLVSALSAAPSCALLEIASVALSTRSSSLREAIGGRVDAPLCSSEALGDCLSTPAE